MAYATAKSLDEGAIPVVDITPLRDGSEPHVVAAALHAASKGLGFVYVKGHGIPDEVLDNARQAALAFFRLPADEKARVRISAAHRGWLPMGGAKMEDDARSDLKESLVWGFEELAGESIDDHPFRGVNRWPQQLPELSQHSMAWFHAAHEVAHHLLRGFALGLGLADDFFLQSADRPLSRASSVYYPAQAEDLGIEQFGVGPHTDFGVLTILCQDNTGGLQVQDVNGEWLQAPPIEGTLIVNVADLLSRWTDGAYKSTPHRVVNSSGRERLSLVLAFDPNPDTLIDARDVFGDDYNSSEPPIRCGEYLLWRFSKAFNYRKSKG
ncbi:MAG: isopenicillin N synthase family dioxygenase [Granulosicoccus sp.]